jgi:hypothetical protein
MTSQRTFVTSVDDLTHERLLALSDDAADFPESMSVEHIRELAQFTGRLLRSAASGETR